MFFKCLRCLQDKPLSCFSVKGNSKLGHAIKCKECKNVEAKEYYAAHKTERLAYNKGWVRNNKERAKATLSLCARRRYALNPQKHIDAVTKSRKLHPEVHAAYTAFRRAKKLAATPKWLTAEHKQEIKNIYALARQLGYEVDHIVPLQGENVSGLHVPWNLRPLPGHLNRKKSNKLEVF